MKFYFSLFLLNVLLQISVTCYGQYYLKRYQVDDGLINNSVTSILQDRKGLIWIGTRGGLCRFDGYNFKVLENKNNKFGTIGNNVITSIAEDKNGILWIGTGKGVFRYDPQKEIFTELQLIPQANISQIVVDNENNLWIIANSFLYYYHQKRGKPENLKISATCIAKDLLHNLWIGNDDGVISAYDYRKKSIISFPIVSRNVPAEQRAISKLYPLNENEILVGCVKEGLKSYNTKSGEIQSLLLGTQGNNAFYVRDIIADNNEKYWIATESGVHIYDPVRRTSINLKKRNGDPYSISDNAVYALCKDYHGNIWLGTYFGGINYYSRQNARFEKYYPFWGNKSISGEAVGEICADDSGNLWIGTEDAGLNKLNLRTGEFTNFASKEKRGDLSYYNIHGLLAYKHQLLIGVFLHGMEIMDTRREIITERFNLVGEKNEKGGDFVVSIFLTKDSSILVGTAYREAGLFIYDPKRKSFNRITQIPHGTSVFHIAEDYESNIWVTSESSGAYFFNPKTKASGNIRFGEVINGRIVNEYPIHYILEDSEHAIWFSTIGGGLIKLSKDRKTIKKITKKYGLPSNILFGMQEDNSKHLWIGTNNGLVRLDLSTEKINVYTRSNGLITDQFNYNSAYKDKNGKMYFGTVKGLIAFNPSMFNEKEESPPTYITGFQINNKELSPDEKGPLIHSILYTDTIRLKYNENNFSIQFAALNYSSPKVTRYKYRMKGLDGNWTYLNTNRNAYFTDLSPGHYEFVVQAESNTGSWVGEERHLYIQILPPYWKSNWAYLFYFLAAVLCVYFSLYFYHAHLKRKNLQRQQLFEREMEKEIYQSKIEFFTHITHEIQTPLTLIAGPIEWLSKKFEGQNSIKKSLLIAEKNTKRLMELVSQLLDFRKTEEYQFSLNFVKTDINALLTEQVQTFRPQAAANNIELKASLMQEPVEAFVDREALNKIVSNLISNSVKYAATQAWVQIKFHDPEKDILSLVFGNDGEGIPDEFKNRIFEPFFRLRANNKPGTGIGLSLARSLAELHHGSLQLISGESDLIIFELQLPIHQRFEFQLSSWKKTK